MDSKIAISILLYQIKRLDEILDNLTDLPIESMPEDISYVF